MVLRSTPMMLVTIPTCGESPYLHALVGSVLRSGRHALVVVNNASEMQQRFVYKQVKTADEKATIEIIPGDVGLYRAWNICRDRIGAGFGALLNDDIVVHPSSFDRIEERLRSGWDVVSWDVGKAPCLPTDEIVVGVRGTYRTGGLAGFAFAFNGERVPAFDETYSWWWGDDDWVQHCLALDLRVGRDTSVGVNHHHSTSQIARPWVLRNNKADEARFRARWPEAR